MDVESTVRAFLAQRFGGFQNGIDSRESLEGVVDSLGLFDLVEFIEGTFGVAIPNQEFSPQRFSTIAKILETIEEFAQ